MPSLQAALMKQLADITFVAQMKKLPINWKQTQNTEHYNDAIPLEERMSVPEPLCYFWPASLIKLHTDTCKERGKDFKDFCHAAIDKTCSAVDMWRLQAKFKDLMVMACCAIGTPGCLDGPDLKGLYIGWMSTESNESAYIDAVKEGISDCWKEWSSKVIVPGLPWYPAFIVYPGPMAPPMPNIPMPLITCPSPGMAKMTPMMLKDAMCGKLDSGVKDEDEDKQHEALFMAIGTGLSVGFLMWLAMQQVMNVMGKGPVPTYAPPYVPVGPVVMGDNLPIPGHLAT